MKVSLSELRLYEGEGRGERENVWHTWASEEERSTPASVEKRAVGPSSPDQSTRSWVASGEKRRVGAAAVPGRSVPVDELE